MLVASHQPHYLPWLPYLAKMALADVFVISHDVQYRKDYFQNRNRIRCRQRPEGWRWLTIPVTFPAGQGHLARIDQMQMATGWQRQHADVLRQEYHGAEQYGEVESFIEYYLTSDTSSRRLIFALLRTLGCHLPYVQDVKNASSLVGAPSGDKNGRLIDMVRAAGGDGYLIGSGAMEYIDAPRFEAAGIKLFKMERRAEIVYPQHHGGPFQSGMAFIDAVANIGTHEMWGLIGASYSVVAL